MAIAAGLSNDNPFSFISFLFQSNVLPADLTFLILDEIGGDILIKSMALSGWNIPVPQASMFAWAPLPDKYKNKGSLAFAKELMLKADVAVAPGVAFGEYGEGFVRVGLVENEQRIRQAAKNVKKLLSY